MKGYQQGDLILIQRNSLPSGLKAKTGDRMVLAEGEHTGHAHAIASEYGELFEDAKGILWLKVETPAPLVHEEHHVQTVEPGIYEVRRVVEVDPFADEVRTVMD